MAPRGVAPAPSIEPPSRDGDRVGSPNDFPSPRLLQQWVKRHGDLCKVTPLPSPGKWRYESHRSAYWRRRMKGQCAIRRVFTGDFSVTNGLDEGKTFAEQTVGAGKFDKFRAFELGQQLTLQEPLFEASRYVRVRRGETQSGDHEAAFQSQAATTKLVKDEAIGGAHEETMDRAPMMDSMMTARLT